MQVSVRELRNNTSGVVAAVRAGEPVTLTSNGEPVADIVPHRRRARRADTLALARAADPIPVTEPVMGAFARLVYDCRRAGLRPRVLDALIAATAVDQGLPVVTQDHDFAALARAHAALAVVTV
jgi:prevent-host-death family protein